MLINSYSIPIKSHITRQQICTIPTFAAVDFQEGTFTSKTISLTLS